MTNIYGFRNRDMRLFHADDREPSLNEQEVARLVRSKPRMSLVNAVVAFLLRSPLHVLLSRSVMLVSVTGRKSGMTITTPVNYIEGEDGKLYVLSQRNRTWWRNLNAGAHVSMWLRGQERGGFGMAIRNPVAVAAELARLVVRAPGLARTMHIRCSEDGTPNAEDLRRAANQYIVVCIRPN